MSADYTSILVDDQGEVARITLNRPPLNILNIDMMKEINRALESLQPRDDVKLLVIDHQGKAFSAGVDIKDHTEDKVEEMIEVFHRIFRQLVTFTQPTLALVDGAALGGGCELATFCDLVLASDQAKFGQPEIQVGVFPPVAAAVFPHLIGRNRALELMLTGAVISAQTAERIGLINRVIPAASFRDDADAFIRKLTSSSGPVLRLAKKAVDTGLYATVADGLSAAERIYLDELMRTEDALEGLKAFMDKRAPEWKNR